MSFEKTLLELLQLGLILQIFLIYMLDLLHQNEIYSITALTMSTQKVHTYCFKITLHNVFSYPFTVSIFYLWVTLLRELQLLHFCLWERFVSLWTKSSGMAVKFSQCTGSKITFTFLGILYQLLVWERMRIYQCQTRIVQQLLCTVEPNPVKPWLRMNCS